MEEKLIRKNKVKIFWILLLIILVLVLTIFLIFSKIEKKENTQSISFLKDITNIQSKLSYYIGLTYSDTFGVYNKIEILSAKQGDNNKKSEAITNSKSNQITPLISLDQKIEKGKMVNYKLLTENVKEVLNIDMPKYEGITWYIENGELLKVHYDKAPEWWTSNLDVFKVGVT